MDISKVIQERRKALGLTQEQVAAYGFFGIDDQFIKHDTLVTGIIVGDTMKAWYLLSLKL